MQVSSLLCVCWGRVSEDHWPITSFYLWLAASSSSRGYQETRQICHHFPHESQRSWNLVLPLLSPLHSWVVRLASCLGPSLECDLDLCLSAHLIGWSYLWVDVGRTCQISVHIFSMCSGLIQVEISVVYSFLYTILSWTRDSFLYTILVSCTQY